MLLQLLLPVLLLASAPLLQPELRHQCNSCTSFRSILLCRSPHCCRNAGRRTAGQWCLQWHPKWWSQLEPPPASRSIGGCSSSALLLAVRHQLLAPARPVTMALYSPWDPESENLWKWQRRKQAALWILWSQWRGWERIMEASCFEGGWENWKRIPM